MKLKLKVIMMTAKLNDIATFDLHEKKEDNKIMPEICRFYGIIIKMFFKPKEHEPSHIHAIYGEYVGIIEIASGEMTEGDLPIKAQEIVREWLNINRDHLQKMWDTQIISKLPPLL